MLVNPVARRAAAAKRKDSGLVAMPALSVGVAVLLESLRNTVISKPLTHVLGWSTHVALVEAVPEVPVALSVGVAEAETETTPVLVPVAEEVPVLEWPEEVEVGRSATVTPSSKHLEE